MVSRPAKVFIFPSWCCAPLAPGCPRWVQTPKSPWRLVPQSMHTPCPPVCRPPTPPFRWALCGGRPTTLPPSPCLCPGSHQGHCWLGRTQSSRQWDREGQDQVPNRQWEAWTCMTEASKPPAHAAVSHQASCIEHKVKDQMNSNRKMATTDYWTPSATLLGLSPWKLHWPQACEPHPRTPPPPKQPTFLTRHTFCCKFLPVSFTPLVSQDRQNPILGGGSCFPEPTKVNALRISLSISSSKSTLKDIISCEIVSSCPLGTTTRKNAPSVRSMCLETQRSAEARWRAQVLELKLLEFRLCHLLSGRPWRSNLLHMVSHMWSWNLKNKNLAGCHEVILVECLVSPWHVAESVMCCLVLVKAGDHSKEGGARCSDIG